MREFTGVCIGGAADGKRHYHNAPYLHLPVIPDQVFTFDPKAANEPVPCQVEVYEHEEIALGRERFGFWKPYGSSTYDAIRKLFEGYKP